MEILYVTLVEECLVIVAISVIIISHKGVIFLNLCRMFNACAKILELPIYPIIALREFILRIPRYRISRYLGYTQTVKYINIPALSGIGMTIEWHNVDRWLQQTGK